MIGGQIEAILAKYLGKFRGFKGIFTPYKVLFLAWQQSSCKISLQASGPPKKTFNRTLDLT